MEAYKPMLTRDYLQNEKQDSDFPSADLPVKVLQIGEGNFMRGFIDWMFHEMNKAGVFNGRAAAIQPTPRGKVVPKLNRQDSLYTLILRGLVDGKPKEDIQVIDSIKEGISPYSDWDKVLKTAESEDVEFVFSNTTEAGITYSEESFIKEESPLSYPGKLVALLYHRYKHFNGMKGKGWIVIPCELVENNGEALKAICKRIALDWELEDAFWTWVVEECVFCNTLVDRIVTGYPRDEEEYFKEKLGYGDVLMTVAEPYHLLVIDGPASIQEKLPFRQAGLNVHFDRIDEYRELKVKLLNAPHTILAAVGTLAGITTVRESIENEQMFAFIDRALKEEVSRTLPQENKAYDYVKDVYGRFLNPYLHHRLLDISLNGYTKFGTRVMPSIIHYYQANNKLPERLMLSLAALILFYKVDRVEGDKYYGLTEYGDYEIRDSEETIERFRSLWEKHDGTRETLKRLIEEHVLSRILPSDPEVNSELIADKAAEYILLIDENGIKAAISALGDQGLKEEVL
ncbi:tagaturonate reductase [Lysinibacillus sphaericus]